jgi:hypothetical protein
MGGSGDGGVELVGRWGRGLGFGGDGGVGGMGGGYYKGEVGGWFWGGWGVLGGMEGGWRVLRRRGRGVGGGVGGVWSGRGRR